MSVRHVVTLALGVLFLVALAWLARLDAGGPPHALVELPGHEPATIYLPGPGNPFRALFPPPAGKRPPAVVLIHGFMADRQTMSVLARRIAENGYAVLAIDVRGHGANRNPFVEDSVRAGTLREDVHEAVTFLRDYQHVDGSRIVVMGHSMGAGAALDYATHDTGVAGAVMISGGWQLGPLRPANALFIFAQHDPAQGIQQTSLALAAHLAGVAQVELGKRYGDFAHGTAVEAVRIPGVDHVQIIYSKAAAATIVTWLDGVFDTTRHSAIVLADPRLTASLVALCLFVVLLAPIGRLCGSMAHGWPQATDGLSGPSGLALVAAALLAAMPLVATIPPAAFLSLVVGDVQVSWFAVAGLFLATGLIFSGRLDRRCIHDGIGPTLFAAAIGFALVYVCQVAMAVTFHRLSLTPERVTVAMLATVLLFPFWLGFELLVRRGSLALSTAFGAIGRALILVLMVVGVRFGVLPFVVMLVLPSLAIIFVMMEIFAAGAYSSSRNLVLIALVETAWFAWIIAATNPITFMY